MKHRPWKASTGAVGGDPGSAAAVSPFSNWAGLNVYVRVGTVPYTTVCDTADTASGAGLTTT